MKIALVNPPARAEETYGSLKNLSPDLPLLGIAFLSAYVRKHGFDVDLLDLSLASPQGAAGILRAYDVLGFSAYITNVASILALARSVKSPEKTLLVGGPQATLFPSDFCAPEVDYIVCGDGELPLAEVLLALREKRAVRPVPGLGYKDAAGQWVFHGRAEPIEDLDLIGPPDVTKYSLARYFPPVHIRGRRVIHTIGSRGCPHRCSFCAAAESLGRRVRTRSPASLVEELKLYKGLGYDSVIFYDDLFTINRRRVLELCETLVRERLRLKWACFTRTDRVDAEMLAAMREAGCYLITFGCESANDKTLKLLQKDLTAEENRRGIELAAEAGLLTSSSFMVGLPGETAEDIRRTIEFARKSPLVFAVFPIFEPFRGTPIYELCKQTGAWQVIEGEPNRLLQDQPEVWVPHGISRAEIVALARQGFREFYFHPRRMRKLLAHALLTLPPARSFRLFRGGLSYFLRARRAAPQKNTHY